MKRAMKAMKATKAAVPTKTMKAMKRAKQTMKATNAAAPTKTMKAMKLAKHTMKATNVAPTKTMKAMKPQAAKAVALKTAKISMKARNAAVPTKPMKAMKPQAMKAMKAAKHKGPSWYFVNTQNIREIMIEYDFGQKKIKVWKLD